MFTHRNLCNMSINFASTNFMNIFMMCLWTLLLWFLSHLRTLNANRELDGKLLVHQMTPLGWYHASRRTDNYVGARLNFISCTILTFFVTSIHILFGLNHLDFFLFWPKHFRSFLKYVFKDFNYIYGKIPKIKKRASKTTTKRNSEIIKKRMSKTIKKRR